MPADPSREPPTLFASAIALSTEHEIVTVYNVVLADDVDDALVKLAARVGPGPAARAVVARFDAADGAVSTLLSDAMLELLTRIAGRVRGTYTRPFELHVEHRMGR